MADEKTEGAKEKSYIGPIEAYKIFLMGETDSNRLLSERTTIYLTCSSILFLSFVALSQANITLPPYTVKWLRVILSALGIFLTVLLYSWNRMTHNGLEFVWGAKRKIEHEQEDFEFSYMREKGIRPQIDGREFMSGNKEWRSNDTNNDTNTVSGKWWRKPIFFNISWVWLPLAFGILWIFALVISVLELVN